YWNEGEEVGMNKSKSWHLPLYRPHLHDQHRETHALLCNERHEAQALQCDQRREVHSMLYNQPCDATQF
ncbi:hypothetical protein HAX54_039363, partial [Datura stramonium]|nr:hypothetical protein [Datura stramonium]